MLSRSLIRPQAQVVYNTTLRLLRTSATIRRSPLVMASYHHPLRSHILFAQAANLHIVRRFSSSSDSSSEKQGRWEQVKGVLRHYWNGSKLLAANVSTAAKLVRKSTLGKRLTRRERRLLTLTAADVARLVPFAFFIIVPFMELLLPFALMLFPNMLPSTFEDKNKKEEKMKKQLKLRMEMAQFLQETTEMMAKDLEKRSTDSEGVKDKAERLVRLLQRVREGKYITNDDLHELASLFQDDFTLEHLSRDQLLSLCRYMGIPAYGRNSRLQYELIKRLEEIREDDRLIIEEGGISTLTLPELRAAAQHRGMQALGVEEHVLKEKLQGWLDLSLNQAIPPALLILSRIFTLNQGENPANLEMIKDTLANLDDKIVEEALDDLIDDNAQKLEDVKFQLELLKEEEADAQSKTQQEKERKDGDDDDDDECEQVDAQADQKSRGKTKIE